MTLASHGDSDTGNIQITYLDPDTNDKHTHVQLARRTFGSFNSPHGHHHYCELVRRQNPNYSFVCEGVETALSVYQAFPDIHLIATLGKNNFARMDPKVLNQKVVLVLDNDGVNLHEDKIFRDTCKMLQDQGKDVHYVLPPLIDGHDKTDMNDILIHHGENILHDVIVKGLKRVKHKQSQKRSVHFS